MKQSTLRSSQLADSGRIDCGYHLSPAIDIRRTIEKCAVKGLKVVQLSTLANRIYQPKRAAKSLAAEGEACLPYLRPYDVFGYFPKSTQFVSKERTTDVEDSILKRGQILQTCSGRNLGPAAIVDSYLDGFLLSNDMLRLEIDDEETRHFVYAYLNSRFGFYLLRQGKTGSVIDHISDSDLYQLPIVTPSAKIYTEVSRLARQSFESLEKGRITIQSLLRKLEGALPPLKRSEALCQGWTLSAAGIEDRIDAAFYDPLVHYTRTELVKDGGKVLSDYATVTKPGTRYKTNYVASDTGLPLLSGGQLLQFNPINLRFMAPSVFKKVKEYQMPTGTIAYPADGRAEEELGTPIVITSDRNNWLASGHVGRIWVKEGVSYGALFLALATKHLQIQIKACSSGSVVDSTFESDMLNIIVPPLESIDGTAVEEAWEQIATARHKIDLAVRLLEETLESNG